MLILANSSWKHICRRAFHFYRSASNKIPVKSLNTRKYLPNICFVLSNTHIHTHGQTCLLLIITSTTALRDFDTHSRWLQFKCNEKRVQTADENSSDGKEKWGRGKKTMCATNILILAAWIFTKQEYENSKNAPANTPCMAENAEDSKTNIFEGSNDMTQKLNIRANN